MLFKPEELVFTSVIPQEELKQLLLQLGSTTVNEMKHQTTYTSDALCKSTKGVWPVFACRQRNLHGTMKALTMMSSFIDVAVMTVLTSVNAKSK